MEKTSWKVLLAFLGIFMAGTIFGGLFALRIAKFMTPPPKRPAPVEQSSGVAPQMMRRFTQELALTPEQREAIKPALQRADGEIFRLRRENFRDTARVMERLHSEVSAQLTPEQLVKLEEMQKALRDRIQQERKLREAEPKPNKEKAPPALP